MRVFIFLMMVVAFMAVPTVAGAVNISCPTSTTQPCDGTGGDDVMTGTSGQNSIYSWGGNDVIDARAAGDFAAGWDGADYIEGDDGNDWLEGERHDDEIHGGEGNDTLQGGSGNDKLYDADGHVGDLINGGNDVDIVCRGDWDDSSGQHDDIFNCDGNVTWNHIP